MATVEVSFSALPVHVRTARLIVTAVARRSGVTETLLDEVRLAVGEACSRAVEAHRRHCPDEPVRLELTADGRRFEAVVSDSVPGDDAAGTAAIDPAPAVPSLPAGEPQYSEDAFGLGLADDTAELGLAVIAGLADDVEIETTPKGVQIRMSWPIGA
ncbi:Anti-sigma regulatory factor (Ser/Thr protein kinase) [Thermomonospora echinospora]|uniref:Anti-sigma regulatory factor (Ser/Thr protein kinase) n=1 Tax=Thermomonospora echinospora TaxID=1992 RepID=A0A1H6CED5_9ACTN|nr:ATP-binding protein [Thermomonospora echinospora]SEG71380.1 Anti-sigma regulatory factor (Ser/Thr protein kinase) [Thermomonospora echinospora]